MNLATNNGPLGQVTDFYEAGVFGRKQLEEYISTMRRQCNERFDERQHVTVSDAGSTRWSKRISVTGARLVLESIRARHVANKVAGAWYARQERN